MSISSPRQTAGSVLLLSGGIESATLMAMEAPQGAVAPLMVDYGQRGARREAQAGARLCAAYDLKPVHLDLAAVGERFRGRDMNSMLGYHPLAGHDTSPHISPGSRFRLVFACSRDPGEICGLAVRFP